MTAYVKAKSKRSLNERLQSGENVRAKIFELSMEINVEMSSLPDGCVIKIYEKFVSGNPYAKAYGVWSNGKVK